MRHLLVALAGCLVLAAQTPPGAVTLDEAIREALSNNLDLAAERYSITIAQARQITARLRPNPVMTASADHLDLLGTGYNNINNAGPNEYSIRTDFVFERGGKRAARMDVAEADRSLAELEFEDQARRLTFDVESAFVDVQLAKENLTLAEDNLNSLNGIVTVNLARVQSGDLAAVELNRSQVAALQFQTAVRQTQLELQQARNRLQLLLGRRTLSDAFDVAGTIRRDTRDVSLDTVRERAQARRPDLLQVRKSQARSQADLRLQLAEGKVDYTAGTEYRRQQAPSGMGNSLGFFFSVPLPLFNRNQGEVARAQREMERAGAQLLALENRVGTEVTGAWQQYSASRDLLNDIEHNMLAKAGDVRQTTEYSYRRGEATLVEFLDAQRAFNDTVQSYNDARAGYARSLYLLEFMTAAPLSDSATPAP